MDSETLISFLAILPAIFSLFMILLLTQQLKSQAKMFQEERKSWESQKTDLLNRIQTKHWQDYVQLQSSTSGQVFNDDGPPVGLNDEEEIKRIREWYDTHGIGDELVDLEGDLTDLGFSNE